MIYEFDYKEDVAWFLSRTDWGESYESLICLSIEELIEELKQFLIDFYIIKLWIKDTESKEYKDLCIKINRYCTKVYCNIKEE